MEFDPAHLLELVGLETLLAALLAGSLVATIYHRARRGPITLGLLGPGGEGQGE